MADQAVSDHRVAYSVERQEQDVRQVQRREAEALAEAVDLVEAEEAGEVEAVTASPEAKTDRQ